MRVQDRRTPPGAPVVAVVGPTASGKSDLGVALATELGGDVVNADAMQLYRGMDIGTAKLPPEQRRQIEALMKQGQPKQAPAKVDCTPDKVDIKRTGTSVMGRRMFDLGEQAWPEEAPFHTPVFVVTTRSVTRGSGRAGPPSTSSTTASTAHSTRPARPPATGTSASRAAVQRSWST